MNTPNTPAELLPCPFCGSDTARFNVAVSEDHRGHDWETVVIECGGCETKMEGRSAYRRMCPRPEANWQEAARAEIAERWNRRARAEPCDECGARYDDEHETWCTALATPQPAEATAEDANVEAVRAKLLQRSAVGLAKYGTTTERGDLSLADWLLHLQEELMDAAVYVEAARAAIDRARTAGKGAD